MSAARADQPEGRVHSLRTAPPYFAAVWDGSKRFEVRWNDRGFQAGDMLELRECDHTLVTHGASHAGDPDVGYTGRMVVARVTYVLETTPAHGRQPGFRGNGYAVLSIDVLELEDPAPTSVPKPQPGMPSVTQTPMAGASTTASTWSPTPATVARSIGTRP